MSEHTNVTVIDRMTKAVFDHDRETLANLFSEDIVFHVRGPVPCAGDHTGVDGFLHALGILFQLTDGEVKLEQLFCVADGRWAAEWETAVYGRDGRTLETKDVFIYRFEGGRIAEIWMLDAAPPDSESFWE
jgi:ketosteroid isomerase-like protein